MKETHIKEFIKYIEEHLEVKQRLRKEVNADNFIAKIISIGREHGFSFSEEGLTRQLHENKAEHEPGQDILGEDDLKIVSGGTFFLTVYSSCCNS